VKIARYVLYGSVLALVFVLAALVAMRAAIHGREVEVPKLVGTAPAEAQRILNERGLLLGLQERFYSAEMPEGRIVSQMPPPGTHVRRGWQVRVAQSLGPQRITVPNVVGETQRAAEINLRRRGIDISSIAHIAMPGVPPDQVLGQDPPAESTSISAPKISLLISAAEPMPQYVMPELAGRRLDEARALLRQAGLQVGAVSANGVLTPNPSGSAVITAQAPPAGQKVGPTTVVTFNVSTQ
jgi:beta-lactam-binding protein with PASTA domain